MRHERNAEGVRFRGDCAALVVEVTTRGGEGNKFATIHSRAEQGPNCDDDGKKGKVRFMRWEMAD